MNLKNPSALILGKLERQYLINAQNRIFLDQAGGNLLHAASAYHLWGNQPMLLARVSSDYPTAWLKDFEARGFKTDAIVTLKSQFDQRTFTAYRDVETAHHELPVQHFARLEKAFPKSLLGFKTKVRKLDSRKKRTIETLRESDLPGYMSDFKAAHFCPHDFLSHSLIPPLIRQSGVDLITIQSSKSYMHPDFRNDLPGLVTGISAFLTSENQLRTAFAEHKAEIWEIAEHLASFNCEALLIWRKGRGQYLFVNEGKKRYQIPAYPSQARDISFAGSSFCGGFLAGLQEYQDPLKAALSGAATASLASEGSGAFYVLDSFNGLASSRMDSLALAVKSL